MSEPRYECGCGRVLSWDGVHRRGIWAHQRTVGCERDTAIRAGVRPSAVDCPKCEAVAVHNPWCFTPKGNNRKFHIERVRVAKRVAA
jgi:hypothetical protein